MYRRLQLLLILFLSLSAYGRQEEVFKYADGTPKYILLYDNDTLTSNTYLSITGDTIYAWDIPHKQIIEYNFLGEYLFNKEYDEVKAQRHTALSLSENAGAVKNAYLAQTPHAMEWKKMHDRFFDICPEYTRILRGGDFTISIGYKNGAPSGVFKKYYKGALVIEGHYNNGNKTGLWQYYPYSFYPYRDITVHDTLGKEYSLIYTLLPAAALILLLMAGFIMASRTGKYNAFFYSVISVAVVVLLLRLYIPFDRYNVWIRHLVPALWFVSWHAMIVLCTIDLFIIKKTNTRPIVNMICLLFGIGFSIYILMFKHLDF